MEERKIDINKANNWIDKKIEEKDIEENLCKGVVIEIRSSFSRSLMALPENKVEDVLRLWGESSWNNFTRYLYYYTSTGSLNGNRCADRNDSKIKKLYSLSEKERAETILSAIFAVGKRGAQSYDGTHLLFWMAQQERARELSIYTSHESAMEALHYFTNNHQSVEASHIAGMKDFHQEASIHAEKVAISSENLERKADWYVRSAGYSARAQNIPYAQQLIDQAVKAHEESGDFLTAGDMMYEYRGKRLLQNLDNDFLKQYLATPEFVEKLPLPERNSIKYSRRELLTPEMLEKAISLFEKGIVNPPSKLPDFYTREEYIEACKKRVNYRKNQLDKKVHHKWKK